MSIVGVGVEQEELLQLVKKYFNKGARPGRGPAIEKAAFHSGRWTTLYCSKFGQYRQLSRTN